MKCPECHFVNPEGSSFCVKCTTRLPSPEEISDSPTQSRVAVPDKLTRGTIFASRYEIIEELGEGGMGKVFRVEDKKVHEEIALKVLSPEIVADKITIERFRNELKLARKIAHKNVCRMYDFDEEKTTHYISMEYVPGEDLKSMIRMTRQLSVGTAVSIIKQICEGLAEAHRLGVVHRDLKPSNIMIDKDGSVHIMDFGIARSLEAKGLTGLGVMIGTPEYMSPEQAEGRKADQRSDIYSLGVIFYEMVTGSIPFKADTPLSLALKHKTEKPRDPKEINAQVPSDISQVILKCMEKDREKRYQTAEELFSELKSIEKRISAVEGILPKRRLEAEKRGREKWKRVLLYGSGSAILILLIIAGISFLSDRLGPIDSIAVLPFENVDADSETEYLGDGITESIIKRLTQLPSLKKVIARSSVFRYKDREIDPQVVGKELGVDAVLVGWMSRRGDELSISVELVKVEDNTRIWGDQYYTREISEIFAIQEEISNSISDNLRLRLTGEELERMTRRYTENTEAFVAYSKGRYFWNKRTEEDLTRAIGYFEQALQLDPNYALAYVGLANSYLLLPEYGVYRSKEAYPRVKEAALKALKIDDMLAEAYVTLAQIKRRYDYDWAAAERTYKRAIELDPNYATAHHWYGYDLMCVERYDEAIQEIKRAHELDPLSLVINRNLGQVLYRAGRYDEALEALNKTLEMDPAFSATHFYIGSIYLQMSRYEDALAEFQKEKEYARGWGTRAEAWIGVAYMKLGQREKTQEILDELIKRSEQTYVPATLIAMLYFVLEEDDQGFQWLEKGYEEYDSFLRLIKTDLIFDRVRSDPRFRKIVRKIGFGN
jgi:serine/threonine protein kinase/Tfp pilus assembly protein PilF